jgi:uncharacterized protein (UPF0332 family)
MRFKSILCYVLFSGGCFINKAFEKRQLGDYSTIFAIEKEEAKELIENGQSFVRDIAQYLKQLP